MDYNITHRHLELNSDFSVLDHLIEEVDSFIRSHTTKEDVIYKVVLLTTEAATNAIEHGNQLDPGKKVIVELKCVDNAIEVTVEDEGAGFDLHEVSSPIQPDNLLSEGGRGIFLIASMADEYAFEQEGRRIRMLFRI